MIVNKNSNQSQLGIVIPGSRTFFSIPNLGIGKAQIPHFLIEKMYFSVENSI